MLIKGSAGVHLFVQGGRGWTAAVCFSKFGVVLFGVGGFGGGRPLISVTVAFSFLWGCFSANADTFILSMVDLVLS